MENLEKAFLIEACTGCTCCSTENHFRGPYKSIGDAQRRISYYNSPNSDFWPLASQFAERGRYGVREIKVERIDGNRLILEGNRIVEEGEFNFVKVKEDGSVEDNDSEYFKSDDFFRH